MEILLFPREGANSPGKVNTKEDSISPNTIMIGIDEEDELSGDDID